MAIFTPEEVTEMLADPDIGLPATWRTIRPGVTTDSGRSLSHETANSPCYAVVLPHDKEGKRSRQNDGTAQREAREIAYVSPPTGLPEAPSAADILIVGTKQYRIEWLDLTPAAGTLLLITVGVQE